MAFRRRLKGKEPPAGWDLIEQSVEDFEQQMRDAVAEEHEGAPPAHQTPRSILSPTFRFPSIQIPDQCHRITTHWRVARVLLGTWVVQRRRGNGRVARVFFGARLSFSCCPVWRRLGRSRG